MSAEIKTFNLPDVGEGLVEARVAEIHVAEGDRIARFDRVMDVETDKAVVELNLPWTGTVHRVLVTVGEYVDVGAPILEIAVVTPDD